MTKAFNLAGVYSSTLGTGDTILLGAAISERFMTFAEAGAQVVDSCRIKIEQTSATAGKTDWAIYDVTIGASAASCTINSVKASRVGGGAISGARLNLNGTQVIRCVEDADYFNTGFLKPDGSVAAAADIPMGGHKLTGLADGAASGEAVHFGQVRWRLAGDTTFFVRKDAVTDIGKTGLTDNAAGAFLTIRAAIIYLRDRIDANGHAVAIQVRSGTYNEDVELYQIVGALAGGVGISLLGDTVTPSNVVINGTSVALFAEGNIVDWGVSGFKITSSGSGVLAHANARIRLGVMEFGTCTLQQVMATQDGIAELQGTWTSTGNSPSILYADGRGKILVIANGTTTGTRTYSATARAVGGTIEFANGATLTVGSGSVTAIRYLIEQNGLINIGSTTVATFFPGNATVLPVNGQIIGATTLPWGAWTPYTPTVTCGVNTIAALGTLTCAYTQIDKTVHFRIVLIIATAGTGGGLLHVTLPVPAKSWTAFGGMEVTNGVAISGSIGVVDFTKISIRKYDSNTIIADGVVVEIGGTYDAA